MIFESTSRKKEGLSAEHSVLITPVCRLCFHVSAVKREENFEIVLNRDFYKFNPRDQLIGKFNPEIG